MDPLIPINPAIRLGRIADESIEDYHATAAVSHSKLEVYRRSRREFYRRFVANSAIEEEQPEEFAVGQAAHTLIVEDRPAFNKRYIVEPDFGSSRKQSSRADKESWKQLHAGKIHVSASEMRRYEAMFDGVHANPIARALLGTPHREVTWRMKLGPILVQVRTDYFHEAAKQELCDVIPSIPLGAPVIADLKSCASFEEGHPGSFFKWMREGGYYRQEALYREVVSKVLGTPVEHFFYIAIEKQEPFECIVGQFDEQAHSLGLRETIKSLREVIANAEQGSWKAPQSQTAVTTLSLPEWHVTKTERLLEAAETQTP